VQEEERRKQEEKRLEEERKREEKRQKEEAERILNESIAKHKANIASLRENDPKL